MKKSVITAFILLLTSYSQATICTWTGGTGEWNDPNKWINHIMPQKSNDEAVFPNGHYLVFLRENINIRSITAGTDVGFIAENNTITQVLSLKNCQYIQLNGGELHTYIIEYSSLTIYKGILSITKTTNTNIEMKSGTTLRNRANFPGDLTGDNLVGLEDLAILAQDWLKEPLFY